MGMPMAINERPMRNIGHAEGSLMSHAAITLRYKPATTIGPHVPKGIL